jgi:alpha-tubulin suppressor-like RCC1 family protein
MSCTRHAVRRILFERGGSATRARVGILAGLVAALVLAVAPALASAEGSSAVSWGDNQSWQLGAGYKSNPGEFLPVTVQGVGNIVQLAPGEWFNLARLSNETVSSWGGGNIAGQLGNGHKGRNKEENEHPWTVKGINGESEALTEVKSVAAGGASALAIVGPEKELVAWGTNEFGQLGQGVLNPKIDKHGEYSMQGTASDVPIPVRTGQPNLETGEKAPPLKGVTKIAAGGGADFALQVTPEGEEVLWAWGRDGDSKLGLGALEGSEKAPEPEPCLTEIGEVPCMTWPHRVVLPKSVTSGHAHIESIVAGGMAGYILLSDHTLWSWGNNGKGVLGTEKVANHGKLSEQTSGVPVEVEVERHNPGAYAVSVLGANEGALAVLSNGTVAGWGTDAQGQYGSTTPESCQKVACFKTPTAIPGLSGIVEAGLGSGYVIARNGEGTVFSIGRDKFGELGRELGVQAGTYKRTVSTDEVAEVHEPGPVTELHATSVFAVALVAPGTTLPAQQLTVAAGEESLTPSWTFNAGEYLLRWARYEECPEVEEKEGDEEEVVECKHKEVPPTEYLPEPTHTFEFTALSFMQPYEVIMRSYNGVKEHEVTETVEGKEVKRIVREYLNEFRRFIWGTPLPSRPHVTGVSPAIGRLEGGTSVTINGNHLSEATAVTFGGTPAASFRINEGGTSITAVSPAHTAGVADVTVTDAIGTSPTTSADHFTYAAEPPVVTSVSPNAGPTAGGNSVTIRGEDLRGATAVRFGSAEATGVTPNAEGTAVTAVAPSGSSGTVDVVVTTPEGSSVTGARDQYTYELAPAVKKLSNASGPANGGTVELVTGSNFQESGTTVTFNGVAGTNVVYLSSTELFVTAPSLSIPKEGKEGVDVKVETPGGESAKVGADKFTPLPTVTNVSPSHGSAAGGYTVELTGAALGQEGAEVKVRFGTITNNKVESCAGVEHGEYRCVVKVGKSNKTGAAPAKATVNGVNSEEQKGDEFTYE